MTTSPTYIIQQHVNVSFSYPVVFDDGILEPDNPSLADALDRLHEQRRHRVQIFIDDGLLAARPDIPGRINAYFASRRERFDLVGPPQPVAGGEKAKDRRESVERIMEQIAGHHLCRQSFVIAIGGGSALDIIGLAAALVHRGVRLIRIPTTVLAQNDSGVGVKNGIDGYGMKNFAGTFTPPFAVLIDTGFLRTLPDQYWIGGLSEAFKVAIIKDAVFFDFLARNAAALRQRDETAMRHMIRRCAELHLDHIRDSGDPFEFGSARPLDFGHWAAHRIEVLSGYEIGHGQAVAIGIALDTVVAWRRGLLGIAERDAILQALDAVGLPTWSPFLEQPSQDGRYELQRGLDDFREHLGGRLNITLPDRIGHAVETHTMEWPLVAEAITFLAQRKIT